MISVGITFIKEPSKYLADIGDGIIKVLVCGCDHFSPFDVEYRSENVETGFSQYWELEGAEGEKGG